MSDPLTQGEAFRAVGKAIGALSKAIGDGPHVEAVDELLVKLGLAQPAPTPEPDEPAAAE